MHHKTTSKLPRPPYLQKNLRKIFKNTTEKFLQLKVSFMGSFASVAWTILFNTWQKRESHGVSQKTA